MPSLDLTLTYTLQLLVPSLSRYGCWYGTIAIDTPGVGFLSHATLIRGRRIKL